jgi:hypothetical protein
MLSEDITSDMTISEVMEVLSQENARAMGVCRGIMRACGTSVGLMLLLDLDDMKIRGEAIWTAYQKYPTLAEFCKAVKDRDQALAPNRSKQRPKQVKYVHPKAEIPRCPDCGLRMRGPNHEQGEAHQQHLKVTRG